MPSQPVSKDYSRLMTQWSAKSVSSTSRLLAELKKVAHSAVRSSYNSPRTSMFSQAPGDTESLGFQHGDLLIGRSAEMFLRRYCTRGTHPVYPTWFSAVQRPNFERPIPQGAPAN